MGSISNPIPPNVVAYVGGINGWTRSYSLWKDGQMIVIQARPLVDSSVQLWPPFQTVELSFRLDRDYLYDLEHIVRTQSVIWSPFTHL